MSDGYKHGETPNLNRIVEPGAPVRDIPFMASSVETVDYAVRDWVEDLNIFTTTNEGFKKVPILWVTPERAYQIKHNKELYDNEQTLIFPLITIDRTSITKDPSSKLFHQPQRPEINDHKRGAITIARRIQQDKTSNFANADSRRRGRTGVLDEGGAGHHQENFPRQNTRVVFQTITIPLPVYVTIMYSITIRTEYQEQMNDIVLPFITRPGGVNHVIVKRDGHKFDAFVQQEFVQEDNVSSLSKDETIYKTRIDLKTVGHIIGAGKNQETPKISIRENAVDIKFPRERVIYGDIPNEIDKTGFYRE